VEQISQLSSQAISSILRPTFTIPTRLLLANQSSILSTPRQTTPYGPHPRQTLDVYTPRHVSATTPILIFLYGGGLTRGDKILGENPSSIPSSLVYHNLGAFFAQRDFLTLIPDYRRVDDARAGTGEGAVYSSGAEDIAAALLWLGSKQAAPYLYPSEAASTSVTSQTHRDVFIMGNSAGGVHLATWLFDPRFQAQRMSLCSSSVSKSCVPQLRGAVLLSVPLDFQAAGPERGDMLQSYWPASLADAADPRGQERALETFCPLGLLRSLKGKGGVGDVPTPATLGIPDMLVLIGELDPLDEIVEPNMRFCDAWEEVFMDGKKGVDVKWMRWQNHISPLWH
jgi:acetyl esterase/lipase